MGQSIKAVPGQKIPENAAWRFMNPKTLEVSWIKETGLFKSYDMHLTWEMRDKDEQS